MCINTLLDLKKDKGDSKTAAIATITINILGVIPQVGLREGRMYADLTPSFVGLGRLFLINQQYPECNSTGEV